MARAPNRTRAKRTLYSSIADQLYPENNPQESATEEPDEDAGDEQDGAAGESPVQPMSQKDMADKVYPEKGQGDPDEQEQDESGQEDDADQETDDDSEDDASDDDEQPTEKGKDNAKFRSKGGKQKLPEYEPAHTPTPDEWREIASIAGPMQKRIEEKDPAKALLYGHTDKDYERRTGKQGQISELQKKLGITVTGVFDKRTMHAFETAFVSMMQPWAEKAEKDTGVPALVSIGQAWLESGHGLHVPTDMNNGRDSNNFFGMKQRKGHDAVISMTSERDPKTGVTRQVAQPFEMHASPEDSVMQHAGYLKNGNDTLRQNNPDYDAMLQSHDPAVWAEGLEKAGYATAKDYAKGLNNAMRQVAGLIRILKGNKP